VYINSSVAIVVIACHAAWNWTTNSSAYKYRPNRSAR